MNSLKLVLLTLFHPTDMLFLIKKQREKKNYLVVPIILLLFVAVRIIYIYTTHYALVDVTPQTANLLLELAVMLIPILAWTISVYLITTITSGEMKFTELLTANAYCLMPYIVLTLPISLLSHVLSATSAGLYNVLNAILVVWVLILLFYSIMCLNNTGFFQTLGICVLGVIGMLLLACVVILLAILTIQFVCFVQSVLLEFKIIMLN